MTDIVERLRGMPSMRDAVEAAAEIERMRVALTQAAREVDEVDRLRALVRELQQNNDSKLAVAEVERLHHELNAAWELRHADAVRFIKIIGEHQDHIERLACLIPADAAPAVK